jgi:hypothetical protein
MIFSESKGFVFFAVPKTGTHSVREQLRPLLTTEDWEQQLLTGRMLSPIKALAEIGHGHISYAQLTAAMGRETSCNHASFRLCSTSYRPIYVSLCLFGTNRPEL